MKVFRAILAGAAIAPFAFGKLRIKYILVSSMMILKEAGSTTRVGASNKYYDLVVVIGIVDVLLIAHTQSHSRLMFLSLPPS